MRERKGFPCQYLFSKNYLLLKRDLPISQCPVDASSHEDECDAEIQEQLMRNNLFRQQLNDTGIVDYTNDDNVVQGSADKLWQFRVLFM